MGETPVAVVTGGTRGIGLACARDLVSRGYHVVVTGRSREALDETVAALGSSSTGLVADVSSEADTTALFEHVVQGPGRLDVLVLNSGGPPKGTFAELDDTQWDVGIEEVLRGPLRHIRAARPLLERSSHGRIVLIGSSSVRRPIPRLTVSNVLRPALAGLVATLAVELGPSGTTVNMVAPGRTDTDRLRTSDEAIAARREVSLDEVRREAAGVIPFGRIAQPDEIGAIVGMLASPEASYVTGQCLLVDGGLTLGEPLD